MFKVKISYDNITIGPKSVDVDELVAATWAQHLTEMGYFRTSNAYCIITRLDRPDWIHVLATKMRCAPADFYNTDGSGVSDRAKGHYLRIYSKDQHTIHPKILRKMLPCP